MFTGELRKVRVRNAPLSHWPSERSVTARIGLGLRAHEAGGWARLIAVPLLLASSTTCLTAPSTFSSDLPFALAPLSKPGGHW